MLLQWCTLEPAGSSNLAAIRFASPVRIQNISIFPTDYQPFPQDPEIVSRTEPDAFFLELYFNAHPVAQANSKEKPKPSNALVSTVLAYAGGRMDFTVNMSPDLSTRLMIVKGSFDSVSMAIYGDVVNELPPPRATYEPKPLPYLDQVPLPEALDPANTRDPTKLARTLLDLIPDAPSLPVIIRLMFCLKPANEEWDLPEFPYIFPDLEQLSDEGGIEEAFRLTSRPVSDDTSPDSFVQFAEKVVKGIDLTNDSQAYHVAGLLSQVACQHPDMARSLVERLDVNSVFSPSSLDEPTLEFLLEAVTNPDVARKFNNTEFKDVVNSVERNMAQDRHVRSLARQLLNRIDGITVLEDAISNTQGDFSFAASAITDVCRQEMPFGILVESLVTHGDLVDKLAENTVLSTSQTPVSIFANQASSMSHDDFILLLRGFIGISCVLAVYAWADSVPDDRCRERALAILRLWQGVDGYKEILDHLLLLRQMVFRLGCMLDSDVPTKAGIDAEYMILKLGREPQAILRPAFTDCILDLQLPHCVITLEEQESLQQAAYVADSGLPAAVEWLLQPVEHTPTFGSMRTLRVALAVVEQEITERDEYEVLQEFWNEGSCSMETCLADVFAGLSDEIGRHFSVEPPPPAAHEVLAQMFKAAKETVAILLRVVATYPLPGRALRTFVVAAVNLFVCTDVADVTFSQTSAACIAAQEARQACVTIIRALAEVPQAVSSGKPNAQIVLDTLLSRGLNSETHEPAHYLSQVFCLIDYLLPTPETEDSPIAWSQQILPNVLRELWAFCRALDTENKAHFVRRLVTLDKGAIGLGDWLLQQELNELSSTLRTLPESSSVQHRLLVREYQVTLSLKFLLDLVTGSSSEATWCINSLTTGDQLARSFALCITLCLEENVVSSHYTKILRTLASGSPSLDDSLKIPLALALLRTSHQQAGSASEVTSSLNLAQSILLSCPSYLVLASQINLEVSLLIERLISPSYSLEGDVPAALVGLLEWFAGTSNPTVMGFTRDDFEKWCSERNLNLDPEKQDILTRTIPSLHFTEDSPSLPDPAHLPDTLELSVQDVEDLLQQRIATPSTPPRKVLNQDVLSLVAISPPTAVIRSPAITGLTKTYSNNDFRQLRQTPSARQNTSRLPSMHVDDFENAASSPTLLPLPLPMSVPVPLAGPSVGTAPYATSPENFASLSPVFKLL